MSVFPPDQTKMKRRFNKYRLVSCETGRESTVVNPRRNKYESDFMLKNNKKKGLRGNKNNKKKYHV